MSFLVFCLSCINLRAQDGTINVEQDKVNEMLWLTDITTNMATSSQYQYYALFSGLNCLKPDASPDQIKELISYFDKEFEQATKDNYALKYRESDGVKAAFDILGRHPLLSKNTEFAKKAFEFMGFYDQFDQPYYEALYLTRANFNFSKIENFGNQQCAEFYKRLSQSPADSRAAYKGFIEKDFNVKYTNDGVTHLKTADPKNLHPTQKFVKSKLNNEGKLVLTRKELEDFRDSLQAQSNAQIELAVQRTLALQKASRDEIEREKARLEAELRSERIAVEATFAGLDIVSKILAFTGNDAAARDLAFFNKLASDSYKVFETFDENLVFNPSGAAVILAGGLLNIAMNVLSFLSPGPNINQIILKQIQQLSKQINQLGEYMKQRFDRVDEQFKALFNTLMLNFDQIRIRLDNIQAGVKDIQASVENLREFLVYNTQLASDQAFNNFVGDLYENVANSERSHYHDDVIKETPFNQFESEYERLAFVTSNDPYLNIKQYNPNYAFDKNSPARYLNLLQQYYSLILRKPDSTSPVHITPMLNPVLLGQSINRFLDLYDQWPEHRKIFRMSTLYRAQNESKKITDFIHELSAGGDSALYQSFCKQVLNNYKQQVMLLVRYWNKKSKDFLTDEVCKKISMRNQCVLELNILDSIDQPLPEYSLENFTPPNDLRLSYQKGSPSDCSGGDLPREIQQQIFHSIPSFLKLADMLGFGNLSSIYASPISFTDEKLVQGRVQARINTDVSVYLDSPIPELRGTYNIGRVQSKELVDFGVTPNNISLNIRDMFNNSCAILKPIVLNPVGLTYEADTSLMGVNYKLEYLSPNYMTPQNRATSRHMYLSVIAGSYGLDPGRKSDQEILQYVNTEVIKKKRNKLADLLNRLKANYNKALTEYNNDFTSIKQSLDKGASLVANFMELTIPVSARYNDTLRFVYTQLVNDTTLLKQYQAVLRNKKTPEAIEAYFTEVLDDFVKESWQRIVYCFVTDKKQADFFNLSVLDKRIEYLKKIRN